MQNRITENLFGTKNDVPWLTVLGCCAVIPITVFFIGTMFYISAHI